MKALPHHASLRYLSSDMVSVIPEDLRVLSQWITWSAGAIGDDGKFSKYPKGRDGTGDAWQKPDQWMTFTDAITDARRRKQAGVGIVLPAQTADGLHLVVLDFDDVDLHTKNPRLREIEDLHERLGSPYIEESPSGRGLRMFVLSEHPLPQVSGPNPLGGKDELFCASSKWATVTGFKLGGRGVPNATSEIGNLCQQWQARLPTKATKSTTSISTNPSPLSQLTGGWAGWPSTKLRDGDGREEMMLAFAGHLRAAGLNQTEIEQRCLRANDEQYEDKLDDDVVLDRARRYAEPESDSALASTDALLEQVDQTDAGNVARLYQLTGGDIRYIFEYKMWIHWSGTRWAYDKSRSAVYKLVLRVANAYAQKAKRIENLIEDPSTSKEQIKVLKEALKSVQRWEAKCRSRAGIDAMMDLAQRDPRFTLSAAELDKDPHLLGVANGVVCLRTGTLRVNSKGDLILRRSPFAFNPMASTVAIRQFVNEISSLPDGLENGKVKPKPRPILARYLQKTGGYWLTGSVKEQVMFMPTGKGSNGKNVLIDLIKALGGDYVEVIQPEILLAARAGTNAEQASPSTRKLAGARCAITSENKDGAQLDVAVVKRHTGDSKMTARSLHENPITFDITHKLVLLTNHPPRVEQMDDALKGRLHVIPFDMRWNRPGAVEPDPTLPDADKDLLDKLKADGEGALLFFVEGAVMYHQEGLTPPAEVVAFTRGYIAEQDTIRQWINEDCTACSLQEGATALELYNKYRAFCNAEGERPQIDSAALLGRRLKQLGYDSKRTRDGACYGLRPKETPVAVLFADSDEGTPLS